MSEPIPYMGYPPPRSGPPGVLTWFKVYCVIMCLMYLAVVALGVMFLTMNLDQDMEESENQITGIIFIAIGLLLFAVCLLPMLLRPRPWLWVYDLVLICLGLTSICFWPISIPLLIYWLKPETKAYFKEAQT